MSSDSAQVSESEFRPGEIFAERYKVLEQLTSAAVSTVYRVEDLATHRVAALRVIHAGLFGRTPEVITAYRLDLNLWRQITHGGVVRVFDFGEYAGHLYVTTELPEGLTLSDYLKVSGKLPASDFLKFFGLLCDALAQLHSRKLIHRDIHPDNILVTSDGSIKLADFGIERDLKHTLRAGVMRGLEYAAPEQIAGRAPTVATDVYSLGAVSYTMLTGKVPPVSAGGAPSSKWTSLESLRLELRGLAPGLASLLEVSLRQDPVKRYKDVSEMLAAACAVRDANASQPDRVRLGSLIKEGPEEPNRCISVLLQIIGRVREMHAAGEYHSELSPQKIWLRNHAIEIERGRPISGQSTLLIPDAKYSAPELLMAQTALDDASHALADIYVLGFVLYELLAGRLKMDEQFVNHAPMGAGLGWMRWHVDFDQRLQPLLKVLPDCPAPLAELVDSMVEKDSSKRIRSLEDVEARLNALQSKLRQADHFPANALVAPVATAKKFWRFGLLGSLITLVIASIAVLGGWWLASGGWRKASTTAPGRWQALSPKQALSVARPTIDREATRSTTSQKVIETSTGIMLLIPAGAFTMGDDAVPNQAPEHKVSLPEFYLDRVEVSNLQYRKFCQLSGRTLPPSPAWNAAYFSQDQYPAINVTWQNAYAFCEASGKRLPSESEWEKAARGTEPFTHWANWTLPGLANLAGALAHRPAPVGSFQSDVSPYGVLDLAGNVQEWVNDRYRPYGKTSGATTGEEDGRKVIRGGSFATKPEALSPAWRGWLAEGSGPAESPSVGFRCALDSALTGNGTH